MDYQKGTKSAAGAEKSIQTLKKALSEQRLSKALTTLWHAVPWRKRKRTCPSGGQGNTSCRTEISFCSDLTCKNKRYFPKRKVPFLK